MRDKHPLFALDEDDVEFVLQLVLASGSLKDLAERYGVSYPTIRARLDRVIARLQVIIEGRPTDPMAQLLGDLVEKGEMTPRAARAVVKLHRAGQQRSESHG